MKKSVTGLLSIALVGLLGFASCKKESAEPAGNRAETLTRLSSDNEGFIRKETKRDKLITAHGRERIAGSNARRERVLSSNEAKDTKYSPRNKQFKQKNGVNVYLEKQPNGKYNGVVEGKKGLITTMKDWTARELSNMGRNQQWPQDQIDQLSREE
jgi:hypothetical protein